jgi:hypothetical protein
VLKRSAETTWAKIKIGTPSKHTRNAILVSQQRCIAYDMYVLAKLKLGWKEVNVVRLQVQSEHFWPT